MHVLRETISLEDFIQVLYSSFCFDAVTDGVAQSVITFQYPCDGLGVVGEVERYVLIHVGWLMVNGNQQPVLVFGYCDIKGRMLVAGVLLKLCDSSWTCDKCVIDIALP